MPRTIKKLKLPFGLKDGQLVHISDAQRGLSCGCICPCCKAPLIARKGSVNIHHFAHSKGAECAKAVETALHLASKQILEEHKEITLPAVQIDLETYRDPIPVSPERTFRLDEVRAEKRTGDIVPDILAYSGGVPLLIEIRVTHEVDKTKAAKIRRLGISAIEIDLSSFCRNFTPEELADAVIRQTANKKWVFNAKSEKYKKQLLATGEYKKTVHRKGAVQVDNCPVGKSTFHGKPYANVTDDCLFCEYNLYVSPYSYSIVCGGIHKITTLEELRAFRKNAPPPSSNE
jgi:hypothetical protein